MTVGVHVFLFVIRQCDSVSRSAVRGIGNSSSNISNNSGSSSGFMISLMAVDWSEVVAFDSKRDNFTCKICTKVNVFFVQLFCGEEGDILFELEMK